MIVPSHMSFRSIKSATLSPQPRKGAEDIPLPTPRQRWQYDPSTLIIALGGDVTPS